MTATPPEAEAFVVETRLIADRYRVSYPIGQGGMGQVVAARNVLTGRKVALKLARTSVLLDPTSYARFLGEARAASMLSHPNVIDVLDVVLDERNPVIVMELLRGLSLAALLRSLGRSSLTTTARLVSPILHGLQHAHEAGLVHRDIKPANLFLSQRSDKTIIPKLLDFGIAKVLLDSSIHAQPSHTATGAMLGTPYYMSPEQVSGQRDVDQRADVWAVGALLYECLSGERLFSGENFGQIFAAILLHDIPSLAQRRPELPVALTDAIAACLSRAPADRPSDLAPVLAALAPHVDPAHAESEGSDWSEVEALVNQAYQRSFDRRELPSALAATQTPSRLTTGSGSTPTSPGSGSSESSWSSGSIRYEQHIEFCRTRDDVRIAYASVGEGPPLVVMPYWLSHLELNWRSPLWRPWLLEATRSHRIIHLDQRGTGLSDWNTKAIGPDAWLLDLEAVIEATKLDRFMLYGFSQGAPTALAYAAKHPERVSHLAIQSGFCQGWRLRGLDPSAQERTRSFCDFVCDGWGRDDAEYRERVVSLYLSDATQDEYEWFNRLQRATVSPDNARRLMDAFGDIDVLAALSRIQAKTLIVHGRHDPLIRYEQAEQLAANIPDNRLVALESSNHILLSREPAWTQFWAELRHFLATPEPSQTLYDSRA